MRNPGDAISLNNSELDSDEGAAQSVSTLDRHEHKTAERTPADLRAKPPEPAQKLTSLPPFEESKSDDPARAEGGLPCEPERERGWPVLDDTLAD